MEKDITPFPYQEQIRHDIILHMAMLQRLEGGPSLELSHGITHNYYT